MNKNLTLVILAAGMGSRFGGLKQIEPVGPNGEFLIDYTINDAKEAGFNKVVFVIKEENYDVFKSTIGKRVEPKMQVEYVFQKNDNLKDYIEVPKDRVKPFGTAHALLCAKDKVNEPFLLASADDYFGEETFKLAADHMRESDEFSVLSFKIGETLSDKGAVKRGVCMEKDGYLTDVIESKVEKEGNIVHAEPLDGSKPFDIELDHPVSMLMFGLTPRIFTEMENGLVDFFKNNQDNLDTCEYLLPDVLSKMIKEDGEKIKVIKTPSKWLGMTYKEDVENIKEKLKKRI